MQLSPDCIRLGRGSEFGSRVAHGSCMHAFLHVKMEQKAQHCLFASPFFSRIGLLSACLVRSPFSHAFGHVLPTRDIAYKSDEAHDGAGDIEVLQYDG